MEIEEDVEEEPLNAYDITKPKDIFKKFNEKWTNKVLNEQKWKIQKRMLEEFIKETEFPKLENSGHQHVIRMVKRLLKNSNINIQACGLLILKGLAKGLRQDFG